MQKIKMSKYSNLKGAAPNLSAGLATKTRFLTFFSEIEQNYTKIPRIRREFRYLKSLTTRGSRKFLKLEELIAENEFIGEFSTK